MFGQTHDLVPCCKVHWGYLAFLAVLLVAGIIFLVTIIVTNYHSAWNVDCKSSRIPLLFQNPELPTEADKQKLEDVKIVATGTKVQFSRVDRRWCLATI